MNTKDLPLNASDKSESQSVPDRPVISARDWKPWQKTLTVMVVAAFAFLCTFASSIIAPAREKIQSDLHISRTVSVLTFSLFNLGLALGPIIGSPASETFGRRPVYLVCMPLLLVFVLACGFSKSLVSLLICRFIGGLFGGPGLTIASATISDLFEPSERGLSLFCYYSMPWLGSVLGPLVGYLVVSHKGWEWTQWVYLFIALPIVLPGLLFLKESKQSVIEAQHSKTSKSLVSALHPRQLKSGVIAAVKTVPTFLRTSLLRPLQMLFTELMVALVCLYAGFNFGLIYAFILVMPEIFATTYNFTLTQQGLSFLGLIAGCIIGPIGLIIDDHVVKARRQSKHSQSDTEHNSKVTEKPPPESRLHGAILGGLLLPLGLFWFAWTARPSTSYLSPILSSIFITSGALTVYVSTSAYIIDVYGPKYGASANGASSITRYTLAAAIPLFILQMYDGLGTGWATSLLAFCALVLMPIPFAFYRWGPLLRARCKFQVET